MWLPGGQQTLTKWRRTAASQGNCSLADFQYYNQSIILDHISQNVKIKIILNFLKTCIQLHINYLACRFHLKILTVFSYSKTGTVLADPWLGYYVSLLENDVPARQPVVVTSHAKYEWLSIAVYWYIKATGPYTVREGLPSQPWTATLIGLPAIVLHVGDSTAHLGQDSPQSQLTSNHKETYR